MPKCFCISSLGAVHQGRTNGLMNGFKDILRKIAITGAALSLVVGLSACSGGIGDTGIQFEGKVFDAIGLSGSGSKEEAKLKPRAPLVVPPDNNQLPVPGQRASQIAETAWPDDPDQRKILAAKLAAKKRKDECANGAVNKDGDSLNTLEKMIDPQKDCKSILSLSINSEIGTTQENSEDNGQ